MTETTRFTRRFLPWCLGGWLLLSLPALATPATGPVAGPGADVAEDAQAFPLEDPHDPRVPVGAVRSFIDSCRDGDYAIAAGRLNLRAIPSGRRESAGPRLARQLKVVLDQKLWIQYETLSRDPEGDLEDGLPADLERLGVIRNGVSVDILLERVVGADGEPEWQFAAGTVAGIPTLYESFGYGSLGELLPAAFVEFSFLEIRLVQWIGLILVVLLAWILAWIVARFLQALARPIVARTRTQLDDKLLNLVVPPVRFLIAVGLFVLGSLVLRLAEPVYDFLARLEKGLVLLGLTWIALRVVDVVSALVDEHLTLSGRTTAQAVVPLGRRAAKVVLVAVAFVGVMQNLGFNVTGLIAGLGVGGLAFALAAQKTIENLFGGISLIADQPVRVGDFCKFGGGQAGTVEEIGLRSTLVRTLDRTVVSIPNSQFSEFQLENFARRDLIRLTTQLGLRYETSPDQMRFVLAELRRVLIEHPRVADEPIRVRFGGFGASSLDVDVLAMIETTDFAEFCALREDLYLRFMEIVASAGTGFAFSSQTLYMARDDGLDGDRTESAERAVGQWRVEGDLPFPEFPAERVDSMRRRGNYPPEGSVDGGNGR